MSDEVEASLFNLNMCGCIYQGPGTKLRLPLCCEGLLVASPNPNGKHFVWILHYHSKCCSYYLHLLELPTATIHKMI